MIHDTGSVLVATKAVLGSALVAHVVTIAADVVTGSDPASWITIGSNVSVVAILALVTKSFLSGSIVRVDVQREAAIQAAAHTTILTELAALRDTLAQMRAEHTLMQDALSRLERRRQ